MDILTLCSKIMGFDFLTFEIPSKSQLFIVKFLFSDTFAGNSFLHTIKFWHIWKRWRR